jgi:hypothetical protein
MVKPAKCVSSEIFQEEWGKERAVINDKNVGMSWETACDKLFTVVPCLPTFSFNKHYHSLGREWWIGRTFFFIPET